MGPLKPCATCRHINTFRSDISLSTCKKSYADASGFRFEYCEISREYGPCGRSGKLYEPIEGKPNKSNETNKLGWIIRFLGKLF